MKFSDQFYIPDAESNISLKLWGRKQIEQFKKIDYQEMSYLAYIKFFSSKAEIVALILYIGCLDLFCFVTMKYIPNPSQLP